jgi:hypothetical protein
MLSRILAEKDSPHCAQCTQGFHRALPPDLAVVVQATGTRCDSLAAASTVAASGRRRRQNSFPGHHICVWMPSDSHTAYLYFTVFEHRFS